MNGKQIHDFATKYFEATNCQIIENSPAHLTVKLSPEADKALTGRSYYWSFVERTGAPPETMTMMFVIDPAQMPDAQPKPGVPAGAGAVGAAQPAQPAPAGGDPNSILGRYFGFVPTSPVGRTPRDDLTFGSRRLEQIFGVVKSQGRFVRLFEEKKLPPSNRTGLFSTAYDTWLGVNYKVELACDLKRDELHSLGIRLTTGEIRENFHDWVFSRKLTPKLPAGVHMITPRLTMERAANLLEQHLEYKIKAYDHRWADDALERLEEELARISSYYGEMLSALEADKRPPVQEEFDARKREIDWQYRPRVQASVINCGLFHLDGTAAPSTDVSR